MNTNTNDSNDNSGANKNDNSSNNDKNKNNTSSLIISVLFTGNARIPDATSWTAGMLCGDRDGAAIVSRQVVDHMLH